jgi:hypothetical protein
VSSSVAKGPKFWPQNTNGGEKNYVGPGKSGAEFYADLPKKGWTFNWIDFALKQLLVDFRQKIVISHWYNQIFPTILCWESLKKQIILASMSRCILRGAVFFRQRPNFLGRSGRNGFQGVGNTDDQYVWLLSASGRRYMKV